MRLAVDAEIRKLAQELHCSIDELAFLERCDPDQLEELRRVVHRAIDDRFRPAFRNIERASRLLPAALTARIARGRTSPRRSWAGSPPS